VSPEPTREELLAQVAALQAQLRAQQATASPFITEVPGKAPPSQPDKKTSQSAQPLPVQVAVPSILLSRAAIKSADPVIIQGQIDGLTTILTSGVNSAGYGDKRTEFRSLTELRQILDGLKEDLAEALGYGGRIRQIRMTTQWDKGL
jgi:hypothetical protein